MTQPRHTIGGYGSGLAAQAITSGFQFAVNLALIRTLPLPDYGLFALGFSIAVMATAVTNALFAAPLSVHLPRMAAGTEARSLEAAAAGLHLLVAGVCFLLMAGGALILSGELAMAAAFGAFVSLSLVRFYYRGLAYAQEQPGRALTMDIAYAASGSVAIAVALLFDAATAAAAFLAMALASAVSIAIGARAAPWRLLRRLPGIWRDYRPLWLEARWALLGAVVTTLQFNAHSLVVPVAFGTGALAPLAAGLVLFGPLSVCAQAIQQVLRPDLARAVGAGRYRDARRRTVLVTAIGAAAIAVFCLALALAWPIVERLLFAGRYDSWPMASIVALWAAVTAARLATVPASTLLQAFRRFRLLAQITVLGCLVTFVLVIVLAALTEAPLTIIGILVGDVAVAALIGVAAALQARRRA